MAKWRSFGGEGTIGIDYDLIASLGPSYINGMLTAQKMRDAEEERKLREQKARDAEEERKFREEQRLGLAQKRAEEARVAEAHKGLGSYITAEREKQKEILSALKPPQSVQLPGETVEHQDVYRDVGANISPGGTVSVPAWQHPGVQDYLEYGRQVQQSQFNPYKTAETYYMERGLPEQALHFGTQGRQMEESKRREAHDVLNALVSLQGKDPQSAATFLPIIQKMYPGVIDDITPESLAREPRALEVRAIEIGQGVRGVVKTNEKGEEELGPVWFDKPDKTDEEKQSAIEYQKAQTELARARAKALQEKPPGTARAGVKAPAEKTYKVSIKDAQAVEDEVSNHYLGVLGPHYNSTPEGTSWSTSNTGAASKNVRAKDKFDSWVEQVYTPEYTRRSRGVNTLGIVNPDPNALSPELLKEKHEWDVNTTLHLMSRGMPPNQAYSLASRASGEYIKRESEDLSYQTELEQMNGLKFTRNFSLPKTYTLEALAEGSGVPGPAKAAPKKGASKGVSRRGTYDTALRRIVYEDEEE